MKLSIELQSYTFDDEFLSTGKLHFEINGEKFPYNKEWSESYFVDHLLVNWTTGLIQLLETREIGLYFFSFENEVHQWVIDYEGDDSKVVVQFQKNEKLIHSLSISIDELKQLMILEITQFLEECSNKKFENEELVELHKNMKSLRKLQ